MVMPKIIIAGKISWDKDIVMSIEVSIVKSRSW